MRPLAHRLVAALVAAVIAVGALLAGAAAAHEVRPALLEIHETQPGWFEVVWKVPVFEGKPLEIAPVMPEGLELVGTPSVSETGGARLERGRYRTSGGALVGGTITIAGLNTTQIDALIQVSLADGTSHSAIVRPSAPSWTVPAQEGGWEVAKSYWLLGVEHILGGIDHLLFVLALLLLIPTVSILVKAITAFTVSHSITLGFATLGFVNMPAAPTEAVIALSILFLAVEIAHSRAGRRGLTERAPWVVAFLFGLFHGLGFAGALSDIGLPEHAIPLALLMFNVGVETGQLLFVFAVLGVLAIARRLPIPWPAQGWRVACYAIGGLAAYWTIERVGGFLWA